MKIILFEPQIPPNTGNIGRLCTATNSELFLVGNLGFDISSRWVKRAGLDYWKDLNVQHLQTLEPFLENEFYLVSAHGKTTYSEINFGPNPTFIFGSETHGLPKETLDEHYDRSITIPMTSKVRTLNLANSVSIVVYEALRQREFTVLTKEFPQ